MGNFFLLFECFLIFCREIAMKIKKIVEKIIFREKNRIKTIFWKKIDETSKNHEIVEKMTNFTENLQWKNYWFFGRKNGPKNGSKFGPKIGQKTSKNRRPGGPKSEKSPEVAKKHAILTRAKLNWPKKGSKSARKPRFWSPFMGFAGEIAKSQKTHHKSAWKNSTHTRIG